MERIPGRRIRDVETLSALAHPVRTRIVDALVVDGPQTVGLLARSLGEAVGNISHHVKVLADVGLVEEVPERARDRRERWWRAVDRTTGWTTKDFEGDPAGELVMEAATALNLERQVRHVRAWSARPRRARKGWDRGPFSTSTWATLSDAELEQLRGELLAVFDRWSERPVPDDGARRETVFLFAHGVPARP